MTNKLLVSGWRFFGDAPAAFVAAEQAANNA
jgi:hypothetical protein